MSVPLLPAAEARKAAISISRDQLILDSAPACLL
jgi:hypothetical protein